MGRNRGDAGTLESPSGGDRIVGACSELRRGDPMAPAAGARAHRRTAEMESGEVSGERAAGN